MRYFNGGGVVVDVDGCCKRLLASLEADLTDEPCRFEISALTIKIYSTFSQEQ